MATSKRRTRRIERRTRDLDNDASEGDYRELSEDKEELKTEDRKTINKTYNYHRGADMVYLLGFLGAAIFYLMEATDFWTGVLGILKALIWPVILVFEALNTFALLLIHLI